MIAVALGTSCNEVRYCAASWEYRVGNSGIAALNDDCPADNRIGAVVVYVWYTVAVSVEAEGIDGKGRPRRVDGSPKMES